VKVDRRHYHLQCLGHESAGVSTLFIYLLTKILHTNRDPDTYPEPDKFSPERFLDASGTIDVIPGNTHGQGHVTYGFGRRICAGLNVANQSLFMSFAYMIWALDITAERDNSNFPTLSSTDDWIEEGIVIRPKPFRCNITQRFSNVCEIVEAAAI